MRSTTASVYERFARVEAHGVSARYEDWASGIAADPAVLALIDGLPDAKRQPNLVLAAARAVGAPSVGYAELRAWLVEHWDDVRPVAERRSTQTNEPARCVAHIAALRDLHEPVALLEVGASAGLCLYPDRLRYRFRTADGMTEVGPEAGVPVECEWTGDEAPPERLPEVVWRAGIDLHPLDVLDAEDVRWLETLVWPEQEERRTRLSAAVAMARRDPPQIHRGDAIERLGAVAALAPAGARLVVVHSAVLSYLPEPARVEFVDAVRRLPATWLSIEGPRVLPAVADLLPPEVPVDRDFVVARDGVPVGLIGPHGQRYRTLTR